MRFKQYFILEDTCQRDARKTLKKIPASHANLVKRYKIIFQPESTLKGDKDHIGFIDEENKTITISAPWYHSREYTLLHEVGHAVWKFLVKNKAEWKKILNKERKKNKEHLDQDDEEIFCMTYAQYYAKNKLEKYDRPELIEFIKQI